MKKKLSLAQLSVKSFVTEVKSTTKVNGGGGYTNNTTMNPICDTFTVTDILK